MSPSKSRNNASRVKPFAVRDASLISVATGISAQNLREFREGLIRVEKGSIFHHFWGRLLQPRFDEPEYSNDFASWAFHGLHAKALAERLSVIDPSDYDDVEDLRLAVLDTVEARLDESEMVPWAKTDDQFHFVRSQLVVLDAGQVIEHPRRLARVISGLSVGSIFYHFIDARRRTSDRVDDFSAWLRGYGAEFEDLIVHLDTVDPFFSSLREIRRRLDELFKGYFGEQASD